MESAVGKDLGDPKWWEIGGYWERRSSDCLSGRGWAGKQELDGGADHQPNPV